MTCATCDHRLSSHEHDTGRCAVVGCRCVIPMADDRGWSIECEDCGWQPTIRPTILSPECDNCGGQLVAS